MKYFHEPRVFDFFSQGVISEFLVSPFRIFSGQSAFGVSFIDFDSLVEFSEWNPMKIHVFDLIGCF